MLTPEQLATLTRVGPGTATGSFMRQFWVPFMPSRDLEAGGEPFSVRLFGEDLVAFRREDDRVGLVDAACAHRRAPLLYARNEGCGLRCVYHGWQYDIDGQCTDMPAEPPSSRFKEHIRITAYPCQERNGIVWTYMGSGEPPELPLVEWNLLPAENVHVSFRVEERDWLGAAEGEIDSAHAPILHSRLDKSSKRSNTKIATTGRPIFDVLQRDFGVSIAARREASEGERYWRVNQFILPFYTLVPPKGAEWAELTGHAWVPIDDFQTLCIGFTFVPDRPLPERMKDVLAHGYKGRETGHPSDQAFDEAIPHNVPFWRYQSRYNRSTNFLFNYELQKTTYYSGLPGLWVQDAAVQAGLAHLVPRSRENLAASDAGIVVVRQVIFDAVTAYANTGELPSVASDPRLSTVRSVATMLKKAESWADALDEYVRAPVGSPFGYEIP